ncbi:MAG: non-canonical purine NTP pyrophosphatase, RdgB/HAM1 family [Bacteroidetes bacterium]|nr:MAG: non-canonical purine NTP pyrophosphatase, RdgB/HAM1 family [Bacteroidota bacterium]
MKIIFATSNPNKIKEVRHLLGAPSEILGLSDINWSDPIEETEPDLEGNAMLKALAVSNKLEVDCFAEDTGLEINFLQGRPGVKSARYAGENNDAVKNMARVLEEMEGSDDRSAQFRTIIALSMDGALHLFEGIVRGRIAHNPAGEGGFGYDPIFIPEGFDRSFGELSAEDKSKISHRARAMEKLVLFIEAYAKCKSPELQLSRK